MTAAKATVASRPYLTKQGDVLDAVCRAAYGTEVGTTEMVLAFNPGLAALGPVLEEGVTIDLPILTPVRRTVKQPLQLWD